MFKRSEILTMAMVAVLLSWACSCAPGPPAPGTPAFYWMSARDTFIAGEYMKTNDNLAALLKNDEYAARAMPWQLLVTGGMAQGFITLADRYETGWRANKTNPTPFRKQTNDFRTTANQLALSFAELVEQFEGRNKDAKIPLAFPFPSGTLAEDPRLGKVATGILLTAMEMENAQNKTLSQAVMVAVCRAAGTPDDLAKAADLFKAGPLDVPRETFQLALAQMMYDQSQLYVPLKLGQPDRVKYFSIHAQDLLKGVPESKEVKELSGKLAAALKK